MKQISDRNLIAYSLIAISAIAALCIIFLTKNPSIGSGSRLTLLDQNPKSYKTFTDEETGFSFQYPSYFSIDDTNGTKSLSKEVCKSGTFCYPSNFYTAIEISDPLSQKEIDDITSQKEKEMKCKDIFLEITGIHITGIGLQRATRCEFEEVPKSAPGGYQYLLSYNSRLFTLSQNELGWTTELLLPDDKVEMIKADKYDPTLDAIMKTVRFNK